MAPPGRHPLPPTAIAPEKVCVCVYLCLGEEGRESREFIPSCGEFALGSAHSSTEFTLLGDKIVGRWLTLQLRDTRLQLGHVLRAATQRLGTRRLKFLQGDRKKGVGKI